MLVEIPGRWGVEISSGLEWGEGAGTTHHAIASSAAFASHVNKGLTTPGLKKVPMPGYEARQPCPGYDRKFNRIGSKG